MDDIRVCPICNTKLTSLRAPRYIGSINKWGKYVERLCTGANHFFQIFVEDNKVDYLKVSLVPDYSVFFTADYYNQKCIVSCLKNGISEHDIKIPRLIEPDFPDLVKLKEKISIYVVFS